MYWYRFFVLLYTFFLYCALPAHRILDFSNIFRDAERFFHSFFLLLQWLPAFLQKLPVFKLKKSFKLHTYLFIKLKNSYFPLKLSLLFYAFFSQSSAFFLANWTFFHQWIFKRNSSMHIIWRSPILSFQTCSWSLPCVSENVLPSMMNNFELNMCKKIPNLNVSKSHLAARSNFEYSEHVPGSIIESVIICFYLEKALLRT